MNITTMFMVWLSCTLLSLAQSEKILLLPHLQGSHVFELTAIGEALVARGHEVHCVIPQDSGFISLLKKKQISPLTFQAESSDLMDSDNIINKINGLIFTGKGTGLDMMKVVSGTMNAHCDFMMADETLMTRARELDFDFAVVDTHLFGQCIVLFPHLLDIPYVAATQFLMDWDIGVPFMPSFMSTEFQVDFQGTFLDKLQSLGMMVLINSPFNPFKQKTDLLQKYAPEVKSYTALIKKARLFIITRDHILDDPKPLMPNVIHVPGYSYKPAQPLPESLTAHIPKGKNLIVVSFGSTAGNMPKETIQQFLDAFATFPDYVFLWKLPNTHDVTIPQNVIALSWLPQNDVLGHNRTALFITHCGANGLYESFYHGVPLIGFPLFAEQAYNAKIISKRGYGLSLDIHSFTSKQLSSAMGEILNSDVYNNKLAKLSAMLHDRVHPKEEMAFWVEHVMKYGDDHIRPASIDMPLYELYMLDILALFLACIAVVGYMVLRLMRCIFARMCGRSKGKKLKSS